MTPLDESISGIFFVITEFMRFNLHHCQKDLLGFFAMSKIHRASAIGSKVIDSDDESENGSDNEEDDNSQDADYAENGNVNAVTVQRVSVYMMV